MESKRSKLVPIGKGLRDETDYFNCLLGHGTHIRFRRLYINRIRKRLVKKFNNARTALPTGGESTPLHTNRQNQKLQPIFPPDQDYKFLA